MIKQKEFKQIAEIDKHLASEIARVLVAAPDTPEERSILLLRSKKPSQKLTGLKKILEALVGTLVSTAKQQENYEKIDELEATRDRIILHLNHLKKLII